MKILCVIDHFGSGGAQRQMVSLALGLKERGHEVEFFIYFPAEEFFRPSIDRAGIVIHESPKGRGFSFKVLWHLAALVRREKYDGMVSFLGSPNVYAELTKLVAPRTVLVVSERSSYLGDSIKLAAWLRRSLHRLADFVVANSHSQSEWLGRYPWLKDKLRTIYNGYDLQRPAAENTESPSESVKLLLVGRVGPEKNAQRLVEALALFHARHGYVPQISWAGKRDISAAGKAYGLQLDALLDAHPEVKTNWTWLGECADIPGLISRHRALVHPSLYEGLPNVICESLVVGRPVIASDICDNSLLVEDGTRGFLCNPADTHSIADALDKFMALAEEEWHQLCANARRYAETNLGIDRMVTAYEQLLQNRACENRS